MRCWLVCLSVFVIATFCFLEANLSKNFYPEQANGSRDVEFFATVLSEVVLLSFTVGHVIMRTLLYGRHIGASAFMVALHGMIETMLKELRALFRDNKSRKRWRKPSPADIKRMKVNLAVNGLSENARYTQKNPRIPTQSEDPDSISRISKLMNAIMAANFRHSKNPSELNKDISEMCEYLPPTPETNSTPTPDQMGINNNNEPDSGLGVSLNVNSSAKYGIAERKTKSVILNAVDKSAEENTASLTINSDYVPIAEQLFRLNINQAKNYVTSH